MKLQAFKILDPVKHPKQREGEKETSDSVMEIVHAKIEKEYLNDSCKMELKTNWYLNEAAYNLEMSRRATFQIKDKEIAKIKKRIEEKDEEIRSEAKTFEKLSNSLKISSTKVNSTEKVNEAKQKVIKLKTEKAELQKEARTLEIEKDQIPCDVNSIHQRLFKKEFSTMAEAQAALGNEALLIKTALKEGIKTVDL